VGGGNVGQKMSHPAATAVLGVPANIADAFYKHMKIK